LVLAFFPCPCRPSRDTEDPGGGRRASLPIAARSAHGCGCGILTLGWKEALSRSGRGPLLRRDPFYYKPKNTNLANNPRHARKVDVHSSRTTTKSLPPSTIVRENMVPKCQGDCARDGKQNIHSGVPVLGERSSVRAKTASTHLLVRTLVKVVRLGSLVQRGYAFTPRSLTRKSKRGLGIADPAGR